MKLFYLLIYLAILGHPFQASYAQDLDYAKEVIQRLTSADMHGRGYVSDGHRIAARYISNEYRQLGLMSFEEDYFQEFFIDINTFPGKLEFSINNKPVIAGKDYLVHPCAQGVKYKGKAFYLKTKKRSFGGLLSQLLSKKAKGKYIILHHEKLTGDKGTITKDEFQKLIEYIKYAEEPLIEGAVILTGNKLTWRMSRQICKRPVIEVSMDSIDSKTKKIGLDFENEFLQGLGTQNVIGYIKGSVNPDSFIVFSAHYDHLGEMGENIYFPGANDDASGVSMVLNLAKYYTENPPENSIAFMAFGAEETGILGSKHYNENPFFPLENILFVINMDMVGTGDEGITVVNATEFESDFDRLVAINDKNQYLVKVKKRGKSANSDHYFFTENGVPAFFIYTVGGIRAYHDIYDRFETLPLTEYEDLFRLIRDFTDSF